MTRLKNLAIGGLAALAIGSFASAAFAEEPGTFQNRLNGATIGLPLGAAACRPLHRLGNRLPWYGGPWREHRKRGRRRAPVPARPRASGAAAVVHGIQFPGCHYSMSAVFAFYNAESCGPSPCNGPLGLSSPNASFGGNYVFANPTWNPISLSWNLHNGWFVSAGFNFMAPIGSRVPGTTNPDYWTVEPTFAVSYLANNWLVSGNFFYDINTKSTGTCCAGGRRPTLAVTRFMATSPRSTSSVSGRSARSVTSKCRPPTTATSLSLGPATRSATAATLDGRYRWLGRLRLRPG